jgi:SAM-dependent methyltransferase
MREDYGFGIGKTIDDAPMIREIFRVLKPGGRLSVSSWLRQEHLEWTVELIRRHLPDCDKHGYFPATADGYIDLLSGAGFETIRPTAFDRR